MSMTRQLIIYGSGKKCREILDYIKISLIDINCIIDSDCKKWGSNIDGCIVNSPDILRERSDIPVYIAVANKSSINEIRKMLNEEYHYNMKCVVSWEELQRLVFMNLRSADEVLKKISPFANKNRERIFDCCWGLGLGGIEEWTKNIVGEMVRNGYQDTVIVSDQGEYEIPSALQGHIEQVEIEKWVQYDEKSLLNILNWLIKHLPCVVVVNQPDILLLAAGIVKQYYPEAVKNIAVIHCGLEWTYHNYLLSNDCIDRYVAVSEDIKNVLIDRGVSFSRIEHMTCPVKCDSILDRRYTEDDSDAVKIGYAGRLEVKQKRIDLLIKMIECLEREDVNYYMEIAGNGDAEKDLEIFIQKNKCEDRIRLLGRIDREQISSFWRKQDICINIADYEGRSITIMEAMANGAVPVVTATSGVKEDITDGDNGYIVDIGDYTAMAEKIIRLEKRRSLLSRMGNRAHDVICPKVQMAGHFRFWEKLLANYDG